MKEIEMTEKQALVDAVFEKLDFQRVPGEPGIVGGPTEWRATIATLAFLTGKKIIVHPDGSIEVKGIL
jgi:hypothetical protein